MVVKYLRVILSVWTIGDVGNNISSGLMRREQRDSQVQKYEVLAFTGGSYDIKTVLVKNSLLKILTF